MSSEDWAGRATDSIERMVSVVRDKAVAPAQRATRGVVFGLLASCFVLTALTLLAIGVFRGVVVLTGDAWIAYLVCGGIFVLAGGFCWSLRTRRAPKDEPGKDHR
jgi:uncharacterized protein YacL